MPEDFSPQDFVTLAYNLLAELDATANAIPEVNIYFDKGKDSKNHSFSGKNCRGFQRNLFANRVIIKIKCYG